jgi:hypothetical protein
MIIKRQLVAWLVGDNILTDVGAYVQGQIKGWVSRTAARSANL